MPAPADQVIWDLAETLPRERLAEIQLGRLREAVARVLRGQPPGARRLAAAGITAAEDINSLDDLVRMPFTSKADLREQYPFGMIAVDRRRLARVHASSGTYGKPTVVAYTSSDLDAWTGLMARCMTMAGVRPGMVVHNANGYGLFTGGLGFHQGGERIGALMVPVSAGNTARQAMLLRDFGAEVLVATPSYALAIAQVLGETSSGARRDGDAVSGAPPLRLRLGLFGGEPWTMAMRDEVERSLGLRAVNFYGLSEMYGPGVAAECLAVRSGLHVNEDHFLVEVVDPADGRPVSPGTEGELVFTALTSEALPLVRYRTGDIGRVDPAPCRCGRTTARLVGLRGRRDDMLIIRGVNLYPSQVEHALLEVGGVTPHYRLIVDRPGALDELTLECEPADVDGLALLRSRLEALLRNRTGLRITVVLAPPGTIPRSEGKAVRVVDRRRAD